MLELLVGAIGVVLFGLTLVGGGVLARAFTAPERVSNDRQYWGE